MTGIIENGSSRYYDGTSAELIFPIVLIGMLCADVNAVSHLRGN
jgi:hypothetical protein